MSIPVKSCTNTFPLILLTFIWLLTLKLPECAHRENVTQQYGLSAGEIKVSHNFCGVRYVVRSNQGCLTHELTVCTRLFFFPSQGHRNEASIFNANILSTQCTYLPSKRLAALTQMNWRHDRFSWSAEKVTANFTMSPTFLKVTITKLNKVVPSNYNVYPWLFNSTAMPLSRLRCDINTANYTNCPNNMEVQSWWLNNKCNAFVRRYRLLGWAWASPTLVRRHCKHACVYMSVCLLAAIYRQF